MGSRILATPTPWAKPWNHREIVTRMYCLLATYGVDNHDVCVRMVAHAIVASGWRQNVWNHNAWGVRVGKWTGDYYQMATKEDDGTGQLVDDKAAKWRAFKTWREAIDDYRQRISPSTSRYAAAAVALQGPGSELDSAFWAALGAGGYYTDTQRMTPPKFGQICTRVREEMAKASVAELGAAKAWADEQLDNGQGAGLSIPFVVTTIALGLLVIAGIAYYLSRSN